MTLDELLRKISRAGSVSAKVSTVAHGNPDGSGNYQIVAITVGQEVIRFRQNERGWSDEPTELANMLGDLHGVLEGNAACRDDYIAARGLEDTLGSGQYVPTQVDQAKRLLSKHGRSLGW